MANAVAPTHKGWDYDPVNARLDFYYQGTRVGHINGSGLTTVAALVATTTVTAATGLTVTTGNSTATSGDVRVTAGNMRLGVVSAFGTTEPTSAVVMKQGTAPVGAIGTSGGIFSDGTVVKKIIADGTASNVET
jgi:hypothetical protein